MKKINYIITFIILTITLTGFTIQDTSSKQESEYNKIVKLKITGMTCGGCANTVSQALDKQEGIISTDLEYPGDETSVTYNPKIITLDEIHKCISKAGFKSTVIKI